jgi:hypothetical protein
VFADEQNLYGRILNEDAARRLNSVFAGQSDIQQDQVGPKQPSALDRLLRSGRFADALPSTSSVQRRVHVLTPQFVVVDDQYP